MHVIMLTVHCRTELHVIGYSTALRASFANADLRGDAADNLDRISATSGVTPSPQVSPVLVPFPACLPEPLAAATVLLDAGTV